MPEENNAAVEIARRKAILDSRARQDTHRDNVPRVETKRSVTIHPSRMKLAEQERQDWIANAEYGVTLDDILKPEYWSHMAQLMTAGDHIEIRAEDMAWVAEVYVYQVGRNWAKVVLWKHLQLTEDLEEPKELAAFKVMWRGPQHKFAVIRLSDNTPIREEFVSKEEATAWMHEHERLIGET